MSSLALHTTHIRLTGPAAVQDKYVAMAEIQRTITRRLSRLPSRFPTLDLDDAQQVQHSALLPTAAPPRQR